MKLFTLLAVGATAALVVVVANRADGGSEKAEEPREGSLAVETLESPAAPGSAEPNFAVDASGRVFMSWLEPAEGGHALRFASHDGRAWSPAGTIARSPDFFVNWADFPSIEAVGGNRLAAHWLQRVGKGTYAYGVRVSQSADGGRTWSAPIRPHTDSSPTEHGFVSLWPDAGGTGAVWLDGRKFKKDGHDAGNEMTLMTTTVGPSGSTAPEVLLDGRTCDCCQTAVTVTNAGPIVAYRDRSDNEIRDIYITRRVNGRWTPGVAIHNDAWKIAACPVNGPALASRGNQVAVAWFTAANDSARVKVAFSDDAGARWTAPVRVDGGQPAGRVDVAMLPDGAALVTWVERIGGDTAAIRVRRVARNGRAGTTATIASSSAARASGFPRMAVTGNQVLFAWTAPGRPSAINVARASVTEFR